MNEKILAEKLLSVDNKLGGMALKLTSQTHTGMPDRIVLMPKGRVYFVELKSSGKKLSPLQSLSADKLINLDMDWNLIDGEESLRIFLNWIAF